MHSAYLRVVQVHICLSRPTVIRVDRTRMTGPAIESGAITISRDSCGSLGITQPPVM